MYEAEPRTVSSHGGYPSEQDKSQKTNGKMSGPYLTVGTQPRSPLIPSWPLQAMTGVNLSREVEAPTRSKLKLGFPSSGFNG